jgi:hypothetical protein
VMAACSVVGLTDRAFSVLEDVAAGLKSLWE